MTVQFATREQIHAHVMALATRALTSPDEPDPTADYRWRPACEAIEAHLKGIPARYQFADLDSLDDVQQPATLKAWLTNQDSRTMWLAGPVGTGKTYAAAALANGAALIAAAGDIPRRSTMWWSLAALLDALRTDGDGAIWSRVKSAPFLVLDDVSHVRATDWSAERLWMIADARTSAGLRQVLTTNATFGKLAETWGEGTIDRLVDSAASVTIKGASRRSPLRAVGE